MPEKEKLLLKRCKKGDLRAYDILMQKYEKKVYNLCYRMVNNAEDAADLAQEVFLKAYRALTDFRGQSGFSTWLYRIAVNACRDELRKRRKKPPVLSLDKPLETEEGELHFEAADTAPGPLETALRGELQREIQGLLSKLPRNYRTVIILRDLQGLSYEEIASVLEINLGTLKSRLNRARSLLRDLYLQTEQNSVSEHLKDKGGVAK